MAIAGALHPVSGAPKPPVQIILISGTSWTVPSDWNNADNKIECIGAGGRPVQGGGGGGGGAYARKNNLALTPGANISYHIGTLSTTQSVADTWFSSTATAKAAGAVGRAGGTTGLSVGDVTYAGGSGWPGSSFGAGGGAAGPNGAGMDASNSEFGGAGDAGFGGAGGNNVNPSGGSGTEWATAGSGGGGGVSGSGSNAGSGGFYGGGGGLGSANDGFGRPGLIVITYTPA